MIWEVLISVVGMIVLALWLWHFLVRSARAEQLARRYELLHVLSLEWRKAREIHKGMQGHGLGEVSWFDMYRLFDRLIEEGLVEMREVPYDAPDGIPRNQREYRLTLKGLARYNQEQRRSRDNPPPDDGNPV